MHIEPRLLVFTKGVRARIAATVAVGLLGVGFGIARLGLLGWLIGQIFVGRPLQELVWPIVLIAVVAVAGLAWVVWAVWAQSNPKVTSALLTSEIASHSATATLKIRLSDSDVHPTCVVRAYAEDHTPVGELSFKVDRPPKRSFTITKSFRTERRATAVESVGCTAPGQSHPR